tara:strand:- start:194 stop:403 length:210 start_codon:yes stop_codon:yes gene_type:complete
MTKNKKNKKTAKIDKKTETDKKNLTEFLGVVHQKIDYYESTFRTFDGTVTIKMSNKTLGVIRQVKRYVI